MDSLLALLAVASLAANASIHARWAKATSAPVVVDLGAVKPAELHTAEWRGQPVWTLRRTPEMLQGLVSAEPILRDDGSRGRRVNVYFRIRELRRRRCLAGSGCFDREESTIKERASLRGDPASLRRAATHRRRLPMKWFSESSSAAHSVFRRKCATRRIRSDVPRNLKNIYLSK